MGKIFKHVDKFFEKHKLEIYSATVLVLLVDLMIALPYAINFANTGLCHNYMVFGTGLHACTTAQFLNYGTRWLSFTDTFIFLPVIIWSMLMPSIVVYVKKLQKEEE